MVILNNVRICVDYNLSSTHHSSDFILIWSIQSLFAPNQWEVLSAQGKKKSHNAVFQYALLDAHINYIYIFFFLWDLILEGYCQEFISYLGHCQFTSKKGPLPVGLHTPITALERMLELCAQHIISGVQHTEKSLSEHLGTVNQSL